MSGELDEQRSAESRRHERLVLLILAAVQFTTIVDFMIVMPLGPQLMDKLSINPAQFGLIISSYTFAAGAAGLVASSIVDRFARRSTFMVLYGGFLLGTLFCGLAPSYQLLVVARAVTGAFGGILGGLSYTIIGDVFPEHRRGRATGSLMTGFALASVAGVPLGLLLGTHFGWHIPFLVLVVGGLPALLLTPLALPRLDSHVGRTNGHPLRSLVQTFAVANHLNAFAMIVVLMIGGFSVFPYVSTYLVANVGFTQNELPIIYVVGGGLTLVASPIIGRLADRYGKLLIFRIFCPLSALLLLAITHLPAVSVTLAVVVFGALMVSNVGRMIAAMAMITSSVEPSRRGGFMSANSSVQHLACGVAASIGGLIIARPENGPSDGPPLEHFGVVGWIAAIASLLSLFLAGRLRIYGQAAPSAESLSLPAAAEACADAGEALIGAAEQSS